MKMQKVIFSISVLILLFSSSCRRTSSSPTGGSWTFKQITYNVSTCTASNASTMIAQSGNVATSTNSGDLGFLFPSAMPTTSGTYTFIVTSSVNPSAGHISISGDIFSTANSGSYNATGGNGTNQTVTVTVNSAGKLNIVGSGIELINNIDATDSAAVNFNVSQTN